MKRIISIILAISMCFSLFGGTFSVGAAGTGNVEQYVYGFTSPSDAYVTETYTTYNNTDYNENWKAEISTGSGYVAHTCGNGIKLESDWKSGEYVALRLRVPTSGTYSLDYYYATHSSYGTSEIYLIPAGTAQNSWFNSEYKLADITHKTSNSGDVQESNVKLDKTITATENNQEFIFIIKSNGNGAVMARRLVLTRQIVPEYVYQFRYEEVGDSSLKDLFIKDAYTEYGSTLLNENWKFEAENGKGFASHTDAAGIKLIGYTSGEWLALRLRVPAAGTYSLDYFYATHSSYNRGEIYLVPANVNESDWLNSEYKLSDVEHNSSSAEVLEERLELNKTITTTKDNQEFIFIIRRSDGYSADVVARRFVLTRTESGEPEGPGESEDPVIPPVEAEPEYVYQFRYGEVGDSSLKDLFIKDAYTEYGSTLLNENWKFEAENGKGFASHTDAAGIKLIGYTSGEWLALRLRVPAAGTYSLDYFYATHSSYNRGEIYLVPANVNESDWLNSEYKLSDVEHNSSSAEVLEERLELNKTITTTKDNQEFIFIIRRSDGFSADVVARRLTLTAVPESVEGTAKVYITAPSGVTLEDVSGATQDSQLDVSINTPVSATAPQTADNKEFKYWKNLSNGSVYSVNNAISFNVASNISLMAVYAEKTSGYLVEFANANREILKSEYLATGAAINAPELPYLTGFGEAKAWSAYPEVVGTSDIQSVAEYDAPKAVSITVVNGSADKASYNYNDKVTVTADAAPSGWVFSHWTRGNQVVSYSSTYSFHAWTDATLTANYAYAAPKAFPSVVLDDAVRTDGGAQAYMMELVGFEGKQILERGILFGGSELTISDDTVYKAASVLGANQFSAMVPDTTLKIEAVRAYVVYSDNGAIRVAYSAVQEP